jgi:hypothetical protein
MLTDDVKYLREQLENHLNGGSDVTKKLFDELIATAKEDERDRLLCGQFGTQTWRDSRGGEHLAYIIPDHCIDPKGEWRKRNVGC